MVAVSNREVQRELASRTAWEGYANRTLRACCPKRTHYLDELAACGNEGWKLRSWLPPGRKVDRSLDRPLPTPGKPKRTKSMYKSPRQRTKDEIRRLRRRKARRERRKMKKKMKKVSSRYGGFIMAEASSDDSGDDSSSASSLEEVHLGKIMAVHADGTVIREGESAQAAMGRRFSTVAKRASKHEVIVEYDEEGGDEGIHGVESKPLVRKSSAGVVMYPERDIKVMPTLSNAGEGEPKQERHVPRLGSLVAAKMGDDGKMKIRRDSVDKQHRPTVSVDDDDGQLVMREMKHLKSSGVLSALHGDADGSESDDLAVTSRYPGGVRRLVTQDIDGEIPSSSGAREGNLGEMLRRTSLPLDE